MESGAAGLLRNRTVGAAAFVGALAICLSSPGFGRLWADTFLLLSSGREIAQHGLAPHEVLTLAAGNRSVVNQQWLAGLIDYETWKAAGYNGLAVLAALGFGTGFAMLAGLLRRRGASILVTVCCATLAIFGTLGLTFVRAQIFAIPLFVGVLWLCLEDSGQSRLRWRVVLVLPLLALWANLHGSVLIGAALAGAYFAYRAVSLGRRGLGQSAAGYAALAATAALMPLATPYGTQILAYYHDMIGNHALGLADIEWDPPAFPALSFFQFAVPLLLGLASLLVATARRRRPPWVLSGIFALSAFAAALAMRNNLWLGIAAAVLMAETAPAWGLSRRPGRLMGKRRWGAAALDLLPWTAAVLAVLGIGRLAAQSSSAFQSQVPLSAIAATASYVSLHPCTRVLGDNTSASALLWLDPAMAGHVEFDAELEAYPQAALANWVAFESAQGRGWLTAARGYPLMMGATNLQPALVRRLGGLAGALVLARDSRGIAVIDPRETGSQRCTSNFNRASLAAVHPDAPRPQEVTHG